MSLKVDGISVSFGSNLAVRDTTFSVESGERFAIMGSSGSGKTTLLRAIAGLTRVDAGTITISGQDMAAIPAHKRSVGLMFQDYALFPHLTVEQNIRYGLRMMGVGAADQQQRSDELLALVGLEGYGPRPPTTLSGGEQQRVALARTLAPKPSVVLLDEPLGSLDITLRESLLAQTRSILAEVGTTAIYVTHDRNEAFGFCDRMAVMHDGELLRIGRPDEIWHDPGSPYVAKAIGQTNLIPGRLIGHEEAGLLHIPPAAVQVHAKGRHAGVVTSTAFEDGRSIATIVLADGATDLRAVVTEPMTDGSHVRFDVKLSDIVRVSADEI